VEEISAREDQIDFLNIEITKFLVKVAPSISEKTAEDVSKYFHLLNDIERIGDHAKIILDESNEMRNKGLKFSQEAIDEFNKVFEVIEKIFDLSIKSFDNITPKEVEDYSILMEKFKNMEKEYTQNHFERLRQGKCTMELGSYYTSTFAHFNSITSHLGNIIGSFQAEEEVKRNNTFDNKKGYVLVINNNKSKDEDLSTVRKYISSENSVVTDNIDNSEKINKSIC
jgi:phosphate:Na+ symporter